MFEDCAFSEELYPDYVPLERQKEVLEALGISISDEVMEQHRRQAEDAHGRIYVEGYPFCSLLCSVGCPVYNREAWPWKVTAFSEQAYWFEWEGNDIVTDYVNLLKGTEAISHGEIVFTDIKVSDEQVNWEDGSGALILNFCCNGHPYEFAMRVMSDWLDEDILKDIMIVLEQQGTGKKIYACDDNGQGIILFYRDAEWAKKFEDMTGIALSE